MGGKLTFSLRRASLTGRAMALEVGAAAGEEVESDMVMMCGFGSGGLKLSAGKEVRRTRAKSRKLDEAQSMVGCRLLANYAWSVKPLKLIDLRHGSYRSCP